MKHIAKKIYSLVGITVMGVSYAHTVRAKIVDDQFASDVKSETGISDSTTPIDTTITIISVFLGLLGVIAVVLILYAGFRWMTAGGNEEHITEAKGILKASVIGIAIILFSYTIAQFIFSSLESATGQGAIN